MFKARKLLKKSLLFLLVASLLLPFGLSLGGKISGQAAGGELKGAWISYLEYAALKGNSEAQFRANVSGMFDRVAAENLNTVIVQVVSHADAIYPSSYYPWSWYMTGGVNPGYDPLAIMTELAHQRGLRFEAWINPYRISVSKDMTDRKWTDSTVQGWNRNGDLFMQYGSGAQTSLMFKPHNQGAVDLITNVVGEIVSRYDVDGIHFDDYFYVNPATYEGNNTDQRKGNVNNLIRSVYARIKSIRPAVAFGVSPAGNLSNCRAAGADIDTWLSQGGYVDYIMPQLYWTDNYGARGGRSLYSQDLGQWMATNSRGVPLYVGLALYKAGTSRAEDIGWQASNTNLRDQVTIARNSGAQGFALFRYDLLNAGQTQAELANLRTVTAGGAPATTPNTVTYEAHVQDKGWMSQERNGNTAGTEGFSLRMEAMKIYISNPTMGGNILYDTHVQNYGWRGEVANGQIGGSTGESLRMEAIRIRLNGELGQNYDIYYRTHIQDFGWLGWAKNGQESGSTGLSRRLEAIQIRLVPKGGPAPGDTSMHYIPGDVSILANVHIQDYGWVPFGGNGTMMGTSGESRRLEALSLTLAGAPYPGGLTYRVHGQDYGWTRQYTAGETAGSTGQSKRLEAIEVALSGEMAQHYDLYYSVHVQDHGWMGWVKNGTTAGTVGESRRLEAVKFLVVPK